MRPAVDTTGYSPRAVREIFEDVPRQVIDGHRGVQAGAVPASTGGRSAVREPPALSAGMRCQERAEMLGC
jgi:hypothetical protein